MSLFSHYESYSDRPAGGASLEQMIADMRDEQAAEALAAEQKRREAFPGRLARFAAWVKAQECLSDGDKAEMIAGFR